MLLSTGLPANEAGIIVTVLGIIITALWIRQLTK